MYLPDLRRLEASGLMRVGTVVVADNCLVPGCPDYVAYIRASSEYNSVCHKSNLEYMPDVVDHVWVSVRK